MQGAVSSILEILAPYLHKKHNGSYLIISLKRNRIPYP